MKDISYILNELGEDREDYFNAIAPPIVQTSNFAFKRIADLRERFKDEYGGYLYSRGLNPTVDILRKNWQHWMVRKIVWFLILEPLLSILQLCLLYLMVTTLFLSESRIPGLKNYLTYGCRSLV